MHVDDPRTQQPPNESRWIQDLDVKVGTWIALAAVACGLAYVALTWDQPHRTAMLVLLLVTAPASFIKPVETIAGSVRRAEAMTVASSVAFLALLTALCALDGGGSSPLRVFFFASLAYVTLAYPLYPAIGTVVAAVACYAGLAIAYDDPVAPTLAMAVSLACVGAVGVRSTRRERRRREEVTAQSDSLRASEGRFRAGFEHSPIGTATISTDGRYLEVNDALCRLLGRSRSWLLRRGFADVTHPDDAETDAEVVQGILDRGLDYDQHEKRYLHADGRVIHALVGDSVLRDADGRVQAFYVHVVDVTAQRAATDRAQRRARQQAAIAAIGQRALTGTPVSELLDHCVQEMHETLDVPFAEATERLPDGRLVGRATRGWDAGFVTDSDPAVSLSGFTLQRGEPVLVDDVARETRFEPVALRRFGLGSSLSVPVPGPDGGFWGVLIASSARDGRFEDDDMSFMVALANVLAGALNREAAEQRLRHLSLHDALTGLPNRTLLLDRLGHAMARTRRTSEFLAVMFLDVDHFKTVNDAYGHGVGDDLLRALTPRLEGELRPADTLARFGGDEFVMLCEGLAGADEAQALAEQLLDVFGAPFVLGEGDHQTEHYVSASIGIAIAGREHTDPDALIRDADTAMYRAKETRGRVEFFDQVSRARVVHKVRTTSELRRALELDELFVAYQPIVGLADGGVSRMEALLRWRHPERGLVSPADFIPIAEESGLILPIGAWVLDEVARQLAAWDAHPDPRMHGLRSAVNLSARQLVEPDMADVVVATHAAHGLAPGRLVCEMTETALIDDPVRASATVTALAAAGVPVSLDDFCTGYSALVHLKRYPLNAIKLDRTFIADVAEQSVDAAIVRGLVEMAEAMNISTVAEGVETRDQLDRLRELGCELAQGFLFSPAVPPAELEALVCGLSGGAYDLTAMPARAA